MVMAMVAMAAIAVAMVDMAAHTDVDMAVDTDMAAHTDVDTDMDAVDTGEHHANRTVLSSLKTVLAVDCPNLWLITCFDRVC